MSLSLRYIIEKVDLVIVGAEGVAESGGIINKVTTKSINNLACCVVEVSVNTLGAELLVLPIYTFTRPMQQASITQNYSLVPRLSRSPARKDSLDKIGPFLGCADSARPCDMRLPHSVTVMTSNARARETWLLLSTLSAMLLFSY